VFGGGRRSLAINNIDDYAGALQAFGYSGLSYPTGFGSPSGPQLVQTMPGQQAEPIPDNFVGYVRAAYQSNGVIFACMLARQLAFSSVRFAYQRVNTSKPSELFGHSSLELLEKPWVGGTTQDLLTRIIQDADLAGTSYWTRRGGQLVRLRPDWTMIITARRMVPGVNVDDAGRPVLAPLGWEMLGIGYCDGGWGSGSEPVFIPRAELAMFAPIPDPEANFRGMSWLTPIVRQIQADQLMTRHQIKFFENGATPNLVVKHAEGADLNKVKAFAEMLNDTHGGVDNAYKTLNLYPGADADVVGANLEQVEFKVTQGGGETRIAAAARVPPIIVGLSEGLSAATYSNYGQARRAFADGTMHPLWANAAGSFAPLWEGGVRQVANGGMVRLWYDARDVPLLREDAKESAEIGEMQARTIRQYVDSGYTPESAMRAVTSGDLSLLQHTGLFSVQLQKPGAQQGQPGQTEADDSDESEEPTEGTAS
jgi:hypothetical protein